MMLTFSILKGFGALEILFSILALLPTPSAPISSAFFFGIRFAVFSFDNSLEILQRGWGPKTRLSCDVLLPLPFIGITALFSVFLPSVLFLGPLVSFLLLLLCAFLFYRLCRKEFRKLLKRKTSCYKRTKEMAGQTGHFAIRFCFLLLLFLLKNRCLFLQGSFFFLLFDRNFFFFRFFLCLFCHVILSLFCSAFFVGLCFSGGRHRRRQRRGFPAFSLM